MKAPRSCSYKQYSSFDFPVLSVLTFDVFWGSLGINIFKNLSSAANNTQSRIPCRLSFCFLWLWFTGKPLWYKLFLR